MAAVPFSLLSMQPQNGELLDQFGIVEIFEFSQTKRESFNLVKDYFAERPDEVFLHVTIASSISITAMYKDERVDWTFYDYRDPKRWELEVMMQRTFKMGSKELVFAKQGHGDYGCAWAECIQEVLQFLECIASLFDTGVWHLKVDSEQFDHLRAIQSVEKLKQSMMMTAMGGSLTHDGLRGLLDGFKSEEIKISCGTEPGFVYNGKITAHRFRSFNASWFNGPMLLKLESENVLISGCEVSDEDMRSFFQHWMNDRHGCGKIRFMILAKENSTWNLENIIQGFSGFEIPLPRRPDGYIKCYGQRFDRQRMCLEVSREGSTSYLRLHGTVPLSRNLQDIAQVVAQSFEESEF